MFDIFKYIDKLTNVSEHHSYIEADCPVCGCSNFKISKNVNYKGAYKCYTSECRSSDIREALAPDYKPEYKEFSLFRQKSLFNHEPIITKLAAIPLSTELDILDRSIILNTTSREGNKTYYYYDDYKRFVRVEYFKGEQRTSRHFFSEYLYKNEWLRGNGDDIWPLYACQEVPKQGNSNSLLMVEGESCSNYVRSNFNLCCVTAHKWVIPDLKQVLAALPQYIENIVYIKDHDAPGDRKGQLVLDACSMVGLACLVVPMTAIKEDKLELADDIIDTDVNREELLHRLKNYHQYLKEM